MALILHTGMRPGSGLNLALMGAFLALLLLGGVSSGVIATEHRLGAALARRLHRRSRWLHLLLFWPLPVLLTFHALKSYWF